MTQIELFIPAKDSRDLAAPLVVIKVRSEVFSVLYFFKKQNFLPPESRPTCDRKLASD